MNEVVLQSVGHQVYFVIFQIYNECYKDKFYYKYTTINNKFENEIKLCKYFA